MRLTTWRPALRLVLVSICLGAISGLPHLPLLPLAGVETAEAESPVSEDAGTYEEQLVVWSTARRRVCDRRHARLSQLDPTSDRLDSVTSALRRVPDKVGHQLSNGLCAPLLI